MKEQNYQDMTDEEIDMLREAGNIASGNAMTSLSEFIQAPLDMSVVRVRIEKIHELSEVLGSAEEVIAGMLIDIYGDINAMLLLALETESAIRIVNGMLNKNLRSLNEFDKMACSVLCETGNILAGSYSSALNTFTGLNLDVSSPQIAIDMAGAILSYPAIKFLRNDSEMLFIQTDFQEVNGILNGTYILILDHTAYSSIIKSMGAYI